MRIQSQLINIKLESTIENCRTFGRKKQEEVLADQRAKEWKLCGRHNHNKTEETKTSHLNSRITI